MDVFVNTVELVSLLVVDAVESFQFPVRLRMLDAAQYMPDPSLG
ncbi:MAG: hypothetical protein ACLFU9_03220 [Candidatus Bathyarchaeia archaeon]